MISIHICAERWYFLLYDFGLTYPRRSLGWARLVFCRNTKSDGQCQDHEEALVGLSNRHECPLQCRNHRFITCPSSLARHQTSRPPNRSRPLGKWEPRGPCWWLRLSWSLSSRTNVEWHPKFPPPVLQIEKSKERMVTCELRRTAWLGQASHSDTLFATMPY